MQNFDIISTYSNACIAPFYPYRLFMISIILRIRGSFLCFVCTFSHIFTFPPKLNFYTKIGILMQDYVIDELNQTASEVTGIILNDLNIIEFVSY